MPFRHLPDPCAANLRRLSAIVAPIVLATAAAAQPAPSPPGQSSAAPSLRAGATAGVAGSVPRASGLLACLILPARSADIGSPLPGIVESIAVDRGDLVRQGQVLVQMRADVEAAQTEAASVRAASESEWRGAMAAEDLALQRLQRARRLLSESFVSTQAVEQAESEWRVARERVAQARDARDVAAREARVSSAQAAQRVLRAPFAGVVTERFAHPGERFEERPLLRLAMVQSLRVEVVVPAAHFGLVRVGQQALVQPDVPSVVERSAQVSQVDRVLDPASNTFRVRIDLPNADLAVPAGARCRVNFDGLVLAPERGAAVRSGAAGSVASQPPLRLPGPSGALAMPASVR